MTANLYGQYVWLIDTIRSAGRITKRELDELWASSALNEKKETSYPLRSFHRHKEDILELFGLIIACDTTKGQYAYYISNEDEIRSAGVRSQLLKNMSFTNQLVEAKELHKRVFFEPVQDGSQHLSIILRAMREKKTVILTFNPELGQMPQEVIPYCLREKGHSWYLAAKNVASSEGETQVYDLLQVDSVKRSRTKASMPRWFDGELFFNSYFGHQKPVAEKSVKKETAASKKEKNAPKKEKAVKPASPAKVKDEAVQEPLATAQLSLF